MRYSDSPTAVGLSSFAARTRRGTVVVTWHTASEIGLLGFNIYRSTGADGPYVQLNGTPIRPRTPGSPSGASYAWRDRGVRLGRTYYYRLEELDVDGSTSLYGPVSVTLASRVPPAISIQPEARVMPLLNK